MTSYRTQFKCSEFLNCLVFLGTGRNVGFPISHTPPPLRSIYFTISQNSNYCFNFSLLLLSLFSIWIFSALSFSFSFSVPFPLCSISFLLNGYCHKYLFILEKGIRAWPGRYKNKTFNNLTQSLALASSYQQTFTLYHYEWTVIRAWKEHRLNADSLSAHSHVSSSTVLKSRTGSTLNSRDELISVGSLQRRLKDYKIQNTLLVQYLMYKYFSMRRILYDDV